MSSPDISFRYFCHFLAAIIFAFSLFLCLVIMVSFWDYNAYSIIPDFIFTNYEDIFMAV